MMFAVFSPGPMEIAIVCVVGVLLFGTQLPKVARSIGAAIPSFKKGYKEMEQEANSIGKLIKE